MSSNIRIVAELEDKLSKDLRKLAQDTSLQLSEINSKLKEAQTQFSQLGRGKADGSRRAELNATISDLKRERDEVLKNEKAEERRYKNSFKYEVQKRLEVEKTTNTVVSASNKEAQAKEKVINGNYKEDASRRSATTSLVRHIRQLESMAVAYYALTNTYDKTIGKGIELNAQFEQMKIGISALIATNSGDETSLGRHIDTTEKFTLAQKDATEAIKMLRKANLETPATLEELTVAFQSALAPAMRLGFTLDQTVKYSTMMTQAAAAMGVPMNQLAQEMRSILDGSIDANSRVATALGITNKVIKEHQKAGDVYEFLTGKLSAFSAAGKEIANSFEGQKSNLVDMLDVIRMEAAKPVFDDVKDSFASLTQYVKDNGADISKSFQDVYATLKVVVNNIDEVVIAFGLYKSASLATSIANEAVIASEKARATHIALTAASTIRGTWSTVGNTSAVLANTSAQIAATASMSSFSSASVAAGTASRTLTNIWRSNPLGIAVTGVWLLYEAIDALQNKFETASQKSEKLQRSLKSLTDEQLKQSMTENQLSLKKAQAEMNKIAKNGVDVRTDSSYAYYADQATQASDQINAINALRKQNGGILKDSLDEAETQLKNLESLGARIRGKIPKELQKRIDEARNIRDQLKNSVSGGGESLTRPKQVAVDAELSKKELREAEKAAEDFKKATDGLKADIFKDSSTEFQIAMQKIKDTVDEYKGKAKASKSPIDQKLITTFETTEKKKYLTEWGEKQDKEMKDLSKDSGAKYKKDMEDRVTSEKKMYDELFGLSNSWSDNEKRKLREQYDEYDKVTQDKVALNDWYAKSTAKVDEDALKKLKENTIQLNSVFTDAFKSMEDSMVKMFMTGKFSAQDFFNTVIEGIIRMQIRNSITQPLTEAIGGINFGSMFSWGGADSGASAGTGGSMVGSSMDWSTIASAKGNAFIGGQPISVHAFANGGAFTNAIVSKPTLAPMALFGEAGAEAIMPLSRDSSGKLGVKASGGGNNNQNIKIEIINQSGQDIQATSSSSKFDGENFVISVVMDAVRRNKSGMRDVIMGGR